MWMVNVFKTQQFLALVPLLSVATAASADDASWAREANDRAEIQAVMWTFSRALDTLDPELFASVFTENGRFGATQGRPAIKAMAEGLKANAEKNKSPPTLHVVSNVSIDFQDPTHATHRAYWVALAIPGEQGMPPRVVVAGREADHFVKVNGKWLIDFRDLAPKD
jgi:uncharacterized protein (TIGR02246 family)